MAELNRLQSNFPYGDDKHFMYVAYANKNGGSADSNGRNSDESAIVGFCDIDARPLKSTWQQQSATYNPRPYLSDLAVDIRFRRRGIARALIHACEEKAFRLGFDYLYLRVKFDNEPAILMYAEMGYDIMMDDEATDDTILLRKQVKSS
jgi:ribosomal protein S18 acetylase RimI-like enzyme